MQLQVSDLDSSRRQPQHRQGEGSKQRLYRSRPLARGNSASTGNKRGPTGIYLFSGKTPTCPWPTTTVQKACRLAATLARIPNTSRPHTLRHSYATGLLEAEWIC